jgi:ribonuclease HI
MKLTINTDGGSLNNPGPAACAYIISQGEKKIESRSFFLGVQTNNVAEYTGVIEALKRVKELQKISSIQAVQFICDSLLLVSQMTGVYKIKNPGIKTLAAEASRLIEEIGVPVSFRHVLRELNSDADALVKHEFSLHHS